MSFRPHPRKMSCAAAFAAVCLISLAGCMSMPSEVVQQQTQIQSHQQKLLEHYTSSPRLQTVIKSIAGDHTCLTAKDDANVYISTCQSALPPIVAHYALLASDNIQLELSQTLPSGAAIQIFKDRLVLNSFLQADVQSKVLKTALDYISAQKRDNLPYGLGEGFTVNGEPVAPAAASPSPYFGTQPTLQPIKP